MRLNSLNWICEYIILTKTERQLKDYKERLNYYVYLSEEEFQSELIAVETDLAFEEMISNLVVSSILLAFLFGLTDKFLSLLDSIIKQIAVSDVFTTEMLDGFYWFSVAVYIAIVLIIFAFIISSFYRRIKLLRMTKILEQAKKIRVGRG